MFSFGRPNGLQFGGVGAMVESPGLRLTLRRSQQFTVEGVHAERARRFAELAITNLCKQRGCEEKLSHLRSQIHIEVERAPREHIGLGVGTQLALSVAAAICQAFELRRSDAVYLAALVGRRARSAIGTHGFDAGGLLIDPGRTEKNSTPVGAFVRVDIPSAWRFVLFCPTTEIGLAGDAEQAAFDSLPAVPLEITNRLRLEATKGLRPAAITGDFPEFSRSLYRFNHTAGTCFAGVQGGAYANERTRQLVERLRAIGVEGVGQSSWGPTVFAACESEAAGKKLLHDLRQIVNLNEYECLISPPANHGATVEYLNDA
jgi:beta-RFAP synthase